MLSYLHETYHNTHQVDMMIVRKYGFLTQNFRHIQPPRVLPVPRLMRYCHLLKVILQTNGGKETSSKQGLTTAHNLNQTYFLKFRQLCSNTLDVRTCSFITIWRCQVTGHRPRGCPFIVWLHFLHLRGWVCCGGGLVSCSDIKSLC